MATAYQDLLNLFEKREESTRLSNLSRKDQVSKIYSDIIKRYEPGGAFGAGYEEQIQRQKVSDVGATAQRDISRGLYGIQPYEQEWEATTGASARLKLEDIRMERLSGAQSGMASFLERIEEPGPDYSSLLAASQSQGSGGGGGSSYGQYRPLPTLAGRGSSGPSYAAGKSPLQLQLATRNQAALEEREKRSAAAGEASKGTVYTAEQAEAARTQTTPEALAGGSTSMTVYNATGASKIINVPGSALGSGPAGFKDTQAYLQYVPSGYNPTPPSARGKG